MRKHWNCYSHYDVINRDVDQLYKETNESHNREPNCSGHCNFLEFWNKTINISSMMQLMSLGASRPLFPSFHEPLTWKIKRGEPQFKISFQEFGPKGDKVTGDWWRLHSELLHDLYCSPNITRVIKSRSMRWAGHVARMGERRGAYRVLVGKSYVKWPLGTSWHGWEY